MSMEQLLDAIHVEGLPTPAHRFVLMAIADDASETTCLSYPGHDKLRKWAAVGDRRIAQIITDLSKICLLPEDEHGEQRPLVERIAAAHPGRRAVYKIGIPERERVRAVDKSPKKPEPQFPHSNNARNGKGEMGERTVRASPVNLSETDIPLVVQLAHQPRDAEPTTTGSVGRGSEHGLRAFVERLFAGRGRHGIIRDVDLEQLVIATRPMFGDDVIARPGFLEALDNVALEIVKRGSRNRPVGNATAYVLKAFENEPHVWRSRMHTALGYWPDDTREERDDDDGTPAWHRAG